MLALGRGQRLLPSLPEELSLAAVTQSCCQALQLPCDGCMAWCMLQTALSKLLAEPTSPSVSNLVLTLTQGYSYTVVFLTSVALHLPTSFSHVIEVMKWSLGYLFQDSITKTPPG